MLQGAAARTAGSMDGDGVVIDEAAERIGPLPLVLKPERPASPPSAGHLAAWIEARRPFLEERLLRHGAILLRGFPIGDPADFERAIRGISPDLKRDYLGTSPRDALTPYVFSASELPPFYPIPQHCEMSFLPEPPARLFFGCLVAPGGPGGETPLVDFGKVYRDLDARVRDRFLSKGVRIIRNYAGPEGGSRFDLWKLKRWDEMFGTTDRSAVEARCRANGFRFTWRPGGLLRLEHEQPAARPHPVSGEPVWFNHSQVFHLSAAPDEYRRIVDKRLDFIEVKILARVASTMVALKRRLVRTEDQAMHCTFGDGEEIPDRAMDAVRDAIWSNMVFFPWRRGDVLVIDNARIAHGRMPYRGPRKIVVAWS
jgi:alpha-ketoglutarate-dependent taurine dioxygenase